LKLPPLVRPPTKISTAMAAATTAGVHRASEGRSMNATSSAIKTTTKMASPRKTAMPDYPAAGWIAA
jgi:hypothetical protein